MTLVEVINQILIVLWFNGVLRIIIIEILCFKQWNVCLKLKKRGRLIKVELFKWCILLFRQQINRLFFLWFFLQNLILCFIKYPPLLLSPFFSFDLYFNLFFWWFFSLYSINEPEIQYIRELFKNQFLSSLIKHQLMLIEVPVTNYLKPLESLWKPWVVNIRIKKYFYAC